MNKNTQTAIMWLKNNTEAEKKKDSQTLFYWAYGSNCIEDFKWGEMKDGEYPKLSEEEVAANYESVDWEEVFRKIHNE